MQRMYVPGDTMKDVSTNGDKKHLPHLDGWRGISLLFVLIAHFCGFIYNLGYIGVYCFFVLSGLLMARVLFVDKTPIIIFYRNRIARIFPVFYQYILMIAFLPPLGYINIQHRDLLYSALFLRTYFGDDSIWDYRIQPLSHIWSLNIEEHCYILLSIIGMLSLTRSETFARNMVTAAAGMCVVCFSLYQFYPPLSHSPVFLRSECAGFVLLASCSIFLWLHHFRWNVPWFVPVLTCMAGVLIEANAMDDYARFFIAPLLLAIAVNTLCFAPAWILAFFKLSPFRWLGVCSYSIYIWQQIFFSLVEFQPWYVHMVGLIIALAVGAVSFYFYEQPMRNWMRSFKG